MIGSCRCLKCSIVLYGYKEQNGNVCKYCGERLYGINTTSAVVPPILGLGVYEVVSRLANTPKKPAKDWTKIQAYRPDIRSA